MGRYIVDKRLGPVHVVSRETPGSLTSNHAPSLLYSIPLPLVSGT